MIIIGIGEYAISNGDKEVIKTYSLGSCVAIIMHHPATGIGAMVHVALHNNTVGDTRIKPEKPGYYASNAVKLIISEMKKKIRSFNEKEIIVKLVGGASILNVSNFFDVGKKNVSGIKKLLIDAGFKIKKEETEGNVSRTVALELPEGIVTIKSPKTPPHDL